jgi:2-iminobutanoate/2-iminopropanoate deaminase
MKTIIQTPDAPQSSRYSQAVLSGGLLFVSGTTGTDPRSGRLAGPTIEEQTACALRNCEMILRAAGASLQDVVDVQVLLARAGDFEGMNACYAAFFAADPPARSIAKLGVDIPGVLVSVRMVATHPASQSGPGSARRP